MRPPEGPVVVKVGGSLYDLPDLGPKLSAWLNTLASSTVLLVPGGGITADVIRTLDQIHRLGEETAHWLALHALTLNAHFLCRLLPGAAVVGSVDAMLGDGRWAIVDAQAFAVADERRAGKLPHVWHATSDAVAARVAIVSRARLLVLLKSVTIPDRLDWPDAARQGYVDPVFPEIVKQTRGILQVRAVNFREWQG